MQFNMKLQSLYLSAVRGQPSVSCQDLSEKRTNPQPILLISRLIDNNYPYVQYLPDFCNVINLNQSLIILFRNISTEHCNHRVNSHCERNVAQRSGAYFSGSGQGSILKAGHSINILVTLSKLCWVVMLSENFNYKCFQWKNNSRSEWVCPINTQREKYEEYHHLSNVLKLHDSRFWDYKVVFKAFVTCSHCFSIST